MVFRHMFVASNRISVRVDPANHGMVYTKAAVNMRYTKPPSIMTASAGHEPLARFTTAQ